jgi:hypothetical protein
MTAQEVELLGQVYTEYEATGRAGGQAGGKGRQEGKKERRKEKEGREVVKRMLT